MELIKSFSRLTDPRRKQGLRVTQGQVLTMVVVAYLCGHHSYRKMATFAESHSSLFTEELGLKHGVPSYITFREVIIHTNESELITVFNDWAADFVPIDPGDWVSGDGKSLCSTVDNAHERSQDFQSVVSFFGHKTGMVRLIQTYRNKKENEIEVVKGMLNSLKDKNLHFILDALHIPKKQ